MNPRFPFAVCVLISSLSHLPTAAQEPPSGHPVWSPDDLIRAERLGTFHVSPAGPRRVLWEQATPDDEKDEAVWHLHQTDEGGRIIQLTRGADNCTLPRWSPDGQFIAFRSSRPQPGGKKSSGESKAQVWLMQGGEPYPLTTFDRDVGPFAWRDTNHVLVAAPEPLSQRERELDEKKDKSRVIEDESNEPPVRVFEVEISSKKVTRVTANSDRISGLFISPDGRRMVTVHDQSLRFEYDEQIRPHYFLTDLRTGRTQRIFEERRFVLNAVVWAPDSASFYAVNRFSDHPKYLSGALDEVWSYNVAAGKADLVPLDWPRGLASWHSATPLGFVGSLASLPDGFVALLADGAGAKPARFTFENGVWQRAFLEGAHAPHVWALSPNPVSDPESLVYLHTRSDTPPQAFLGALHGNRLETKTQITKLNPGWNEKPRAKVERVYWIGARGDTIEGLLFYPHRFREGARHPLILQIHGGPYSADRDAWTENWHAPVQPYCERGAFVLKVNYHGSSGYGSKFARSISGGAAYYDLPVEDLEKGVDAMIERGLADPNRIGAMGWSNGGILTLALIVHNPARYKAAVSGAGGFEWVADTSITSFGQSFNDFYFGGMPWENPELYRNLAPYYRADRIRTPLLILHGDADTAVPIHHGWMQFRALQQRTTTPVRFVVFPGEEHGLKKISFMRRKVSEELAWMDQHLFQQAPVTVAPVKAGSPLAALRDRSRAKREGGERFGVMVNGKLAPETVLFRGIHVSRFEVTRAQYAEFDATYPVQAGRENFPAGGILFEQALAYCDWLTRLTGAQWRLPNALEADRLHAAAADPGAANTLDDWAGYPPNAEDAFRLQEIARELGEGVLLREVGSLSGTGPDPVFDLSGNVAEWVLELAGLGRLAGGSADQPAEPLVARPVAGPAYTGFRPVRD